MFRNIVYCNENGKYTDVIQKKTLFFLFDKTFKLFFLFKYYKNHNLIVFPRWKIKYIGVANGRIIKSFETNNKTIIDYLTIIKCTYSFKLF